MTDGFHVPVMPLPEIRGRTGAALFRHSGPMWVKTGIICEAVTWTLIVAAVAH